MSEEGSKKEKEDLMKEGVGKRAGGKGRRQCEEKAREESRE